MPEITDTATVPPNPKPPKVSLLKRPRFIMGAALVLLVAIVLGAWFLAGAWTRESTDDAFVDADIVSIAPKVAGSIQSVYVSDNQPVKKGDPLFDIDPRDYQAVVNQDIQTVNVNKAKEADQQASYEQALAHENTLQAVYESTQATVAQARSDASKTSDDYVRNRKLVATGVISAEDYDHSQSDTTSAAANLQSKVKQQDAADAYRVEAGSQAASSKAQWDAQKATTAQAEAELDKSKLQLSYTKVAAPQDGRVTQRAVHAGDYVQTGQVLLALVPADVWVTANFKETQLTHMRPGQPAEISVDAFPAHVFKGHVDSIQAGSGARFSLLPPENATGNYVKVVQRVPVKITLDELPGNGEVLGPGMSVTPVVITGDTAGAVFAATIFALVAGALVIIGALIPLKRAR